tara:strand:- start:107 stop:226 length:120 start_codon:yes stop_codon:yes gene_type:complete
MREPLEGVPKGAKEIFIIISPDYGINNKNIKLLYHYITH